MLADGYQEWMKESTVLDRGTRSREVDIQRSVEFIKKVPTYTKTRGRKENIRKRRGSSSIRSGYNQ